MRELLILNALLVAACLATEDTQLEPHTFYLLCYKRDLKCLEAE